MELLVFRVAQHQAVFRIPQNKGLGNIFNRVFQAKLRILVELVRLLLRRDVKNDADEMRRFRIVARRQGGPRPEPNPMAVLVAHPEFAVEHRALAAQQLFNHEFDVGVFRMKPFRHFAKTQKLALGRKPEDFIHGLGPENRALGQVPVPHAAVAAIKRLVQPLGGDCQGAIGFGGFRRLPVKGAGQHGENHDGRQQREWKDG